MLRYDSMTLTNELDLDNLTMYTNTKMKFLGQGLQELEPKPDRQTDRQTARQTDRHD